MPQRGEVARSITLRRGHMAEVAMSTSTPLVAGPQHAEDTKLLKEVAERTPGDSRLEMCIQCGTCGGSCPSAAVMDHTPRAIFAMLKAGMRDEVLRSNTFWQCVSCYHCVVRCPQNVHITDVMYTLKCMAVEKGLYKSSTAPEFSQTFIDMVENSGRSFELGLASIHYLKHFPLRLPSLTPMAFGMLTRKRMSLMPSRIKQLPQLKAILKRAKELEAQQ